LSQKDAQEIKCQNETVAKLKDDASKIHLIAETLWLRARFEAASAALKKVVCLPFISEGCP
jgi:hypothetical protein